MQIPSYLQIKKKRLTLIQQTGYLLKSLTKVGNGRPTDVRDFSLVKKTVCKCRRHLHNIKVFAFNRKAKS